MHTLILECSDELQVFVVHLHALNPQGSTW